MTVLVLDIVSIESLPLMSMPSDDAFPMPQKNDNGTDITNAHGQEMTNIVSARYAHVDNSPPNNNGGMTATINAITRMIGVYTLENDVMNLSLLDLFLSASSMSSSSTL